MTRYDILLRTEDRGLYSVSIHDEYDLELLAPRKVYYLASYDEAIDFIEYISTENRLQTVERLLVNFRKEQKELRHD